MARKKTVLTAGNLRLDFEAGLVQDGSGKPMSLTPKEAHLLATFMRYPGEVLSRRFLMRQVWETTYTGDTRTLEVHVCWLRKKIGRGRVRTVRGVGYRFET